MFQKLIIDIEKYCHNFHCSTTTFGRKSVGDGKFVARLKKGGRCWPETIDRVYQHMAENPPPSNTPSTHEVSNGGG